MASSKQAQSRLYQRIYQLVAQIPPGKVATYGQVAELLGGVSRARQVGYALYRVDLRSEIPWHRVVNAKGQVSRSPQRQGSDAVQQVLLAEEGIVFNESDTIDLKRYRWQPEITALNFADLEHLEDHPLAD